MESISDKSMLKIILSKFAMESRHMDLEKIKELLSYDRVFKERFAEQMVQYFLDFKSWREVRETIILEIDKCYKPKIKKLNILY